MKRIFIALLSVLIIGLGVSNTFFAKGNDVSVQIETIEVVNDSEIEDYYEGEFLLRKVFYYIYHNKSNYIPVRIEFTAETNNENKSKYTTARIDSRNKILYDVLPYNICESAIEFEKDVSCKFDIYAYIKQNDNSSNIENHIKDTVEIRLK